MAGVDWTRLKHARGSAAAVPGLLDDLRAGDAATQQRSLATLTDSLYAKNKWYPAAAAAIGPLLDLATDARAPRHAVLVLLANILAGNHEERLVTGLDLADPAVKPLFAKGAAKEILGAVSTGMERLAQGLKDPDARVRGATAFLLAFVPAAASQTGPALAQLAKEDDADANASLVLCLGYWARYAKDAAIPLQDRLRMLAKDLEGACTLALSRSDQKAVSLSSVAPLAKLIAWGDRGAAFPWCGGKPDVVVERLLSADTATRPIAARAFGTAVAQNPATPGPVLARWSERALFLSFTPRNEPLLPDEVDASQREIVTLLSTRDVRGDWTGPYGIPHRARDRKRWIGLTPATPLEQVNTVDVGGKNQTWPLWRALYELELRLRTPEDGVDDWLSRLIGSKQRLDVYGNAALQSYGLKQPTPDLLSRAIDAAGATDARVWAVGLADELLSFEPDWLAWAVSALGRPLVLVLLKGGELASKYDCLVSLAGDAVVTRSILERIPPARRDGIFMADLCRGQPMSLGYVTPLLDLCPTKTVVDQIFALLDPKTLLARMGGGKEFREKQIAMLRGLAKEAPEIQQALARSGDG